jgi:hypothetical protein
MTAVEKIVYHLNDVGPLSVQQVKSVYGVKNVKTLFRNRKDIQYVYRTDDLGKKTEFVQSKTACKQNQVINHFKSGLPLSSKEMRYYFDIPNPSALINDIRKKGFDIKLETSTTSDGEKVSFYSLSLIKAKSKSKKSMFVDAMNKLRQNKQEIVA